MKNHVILEDERSDIKKFAAYLERIVPSEFDGRNVVVNLQKYKELELDDLLLFLNVSNSHRAKKNSFILVNTSVDIDDVPFEMIVVPTLQEAADIVEMEEIERDLGF